MVKPLRKEKSPDEIIEYLKDHLVDVRHVPCKVATLDVKRQTMDEMARRKLGQTP